MGKHPFDDGRSWAVLPAGVLALGLAGWMTPASSARPAPPIAHRRAPPTPPPVALPPETDLHLARLHAYTTAVTSPQLLDRSPFEFATPRRRVPAALPLAVGDRETATALPLTVEPPAPPPALVGIAEQNEAGGVVRTAIFTSSDGVVSFALIGEIAGAFRVTSIESNRVVLVDSRGGETSTLVLK